MAIGFGISEVNSAMADAHSMMSLFASSRVQKKENLDSFSFLVSFSFSISFVFSLRHSEAFSFVFSSSGFQKKDNSEMDFVHGVTGDEMSFMGEVEWS